MRTIAAIIFITVAISFAATDSAPHPFSVHDMLAMDRISDPQLSPDGKLIAFTIRKTDLKANKGKTDLYLIDSDGTNLRQLTTHDAADFNPRFSPDSTIVYFLSARSESSQVWQISPTGGEATQLTDLPLDISNLIVSPTGTHIAFTMDVFPSTTPQQTKDKLKEIADSKATGRVYDKLFVRHWDTWKDGTRSHLFAMPVAGTDPIDVMPDMDADTPSKPFGGSEEFTFTPNGQGLVFTARNAGKSEAWSTNFDLYLALVDGSKPPRNITSENKAWDTAPVFAPNAKALASLAMKTPNYESDRQRIIIRTNEDDPSQTITLTEDWDRSASSITFSPDSKTIYTTANNLGQTSLFAIDTQTAKVRTIVKDGSVSIFAATADRVYYTMHNLKAPAEIFSTKTDGTDTKQLTNINAEKVAAAKTGDYEQFTFKGANNDTVYCYIVKPVDFDPAQKYPVAFLIHGGPQGSFGNMFHYRWNAQAYAGAGYAAVMVDFHGSTGYGQKFTDSIQSDWGGKPLEDLQKGLAAALDRYPWMNADKVAALGASYGGYMINWIAGNWPDRFTCLVNHDGNLDERFAYFDTEELWFPERDHKGTPWTNPKGYEKHNPVNYIQNWKTPMLVIHGGQDFRVVETQGLGTFTTLQRMGIPSKLLYFPDENHWILKPQNSIQWHNTTLQWLNQWTK